MNVAPSGKRSNNNQQPSIRSTIGIGVQTINSSTIRSTSDFQIWKKYVSFWKQRQNSKNANYHFPFWEIEETQQNNHTNNWYYSSWGAIPVESPPEATTFPQRYVEERLRRDIMANMTKLTSRAIVRNEFIHATDKKRIVETILPHLSAYYCYFYDAKSRKTSTRKMLTVKK